MANVKDIELKNLNSTAKKGKSGKSPTDKKSARNCELHATLKEEKILSVYKLLSCNSVVYVLLTCGLIFGNLLIASNVERFNTFRCSK